MKKTKKTDIREITISDKDREKLMLLQKADEIKGERLSILDSGKIKSFKEFKKENIIPTDNPEEKYRIYYKAIRNLLMKNLPKGKRFKRERDFIYEEKNTFLTRGKRKSKSGIRGADSRMTYLEDAEEILNVIFKWITSKGTMIELFFSLRNLNESKGYKSPK